MRSAGVDPGKLTCPEPHENMGRDFDISKLIRGEDKVSEKVAQRINMLLVSVRDILKDQLANAIFPWSASRRLELPSFRSVNGFHGKCGIIGHMDFLHGIARAAGIDFFKLGNGDWNTDYTGKGRELISLIEEGYEFVYCHVNAPDECSHMGDLERKVNSLEEIDREIVAPLIEYFMAHSDMLGGVIFATDHFTNHFPRKDDVTRSETHSMHLVPFCIWNGRERDQARRFSETDAAFGKYGENPISHLALLNLLRSADADHGLVSEQ